MLTQVVGPAALEGWLPEYQRNAREVLPTPRYVASPARRAVYYAMYLKSEARVKEIWLAKFPGIPFRGSTKLPAPIEPQKISARDLAENQEYPLKPIAGDRE